MCIRDSISNVDATLAKDQATKALNDNQGVLEGARETIAVMGKNYINPLCALFSDFFRAASLSFFETACLLYQLLSFLSRTSF